MDIKGVAAVVTGGASGLGEATARALAAKGAKVAIFDRDTDRGWTVELAFPWTGFRWLATDGRALPPRDGDVWRMDFSRFNTYKAPAPAQDSGGWVWTRHGVWDSHIPECFVHVQFTTKAVSEAPRGHPAARALID